MKSDYGDSVAAFVVATEMKLATGLTAVRRHAEAVARFCGIPIYRITR